MIGSQGFSVARHAPLTAPAVAAAATGIIPHGTSVRSHLIPRGEVAAFLRDSFWQQPVFHHTSSDNVARIAAEGIDVTRGGGSHGQGFYTVSHKTSDARWGAMHPAIEVAVQTRNTLHINAGSSRTVAEALGMDWARILATQGREQGRLQIRSAALAAGYDSIVDHRGGGRIWIIGLLDDRAKVVVR